jgi:osmotically inducible protein OsmC
VKRRKAMATEKTARATWEGDLLHGSGHVTTGTGSVDADMTWAARAEDVEGPSPEELIVAAHATCVSMALAAGLARAGSPPTRLETEATTAFEKAGEGFKLSSVRLAIRGEVDGLDDEGFRAAAEEAKENCPVSQALKGNVDISVDASLANRSPSRSS